MSGERRTVLYAEFTALPGREDEVAELIGAFANTVRQEPGNVLFAVSRKAAAPSEFFVYEEYEDEAGFQTHIAADYGQTFNSALAPLVEGGASTLTFLDPV